MNVCLIGNFSETLDEGMKVIAQCLAQELVKYHHVLKVSMYKAFRFDVWRKLSKFHPDILHYVSGPSPFSFMILWALQVSCRVQSHHPINAVMSATQPWLPFNSISFLRKFKPNLLIVQSNRNEEYFRRMGFYVKYLPNGVDVKRFTPVKERQKEELRTKYGFGDNEFIILHVGPIRANRGLDVMKHVANVKDCRVLIVGSTSSPAKKSVFLDLVKSGCIVWRKYIKSIPEIYQLADLYVFPVEDQFGSIDVPLSVLEAMACNLPVITTRFGGFPRMFSEEDGFFFVKSRHELPQAVGEVRSHILGRRVDTRTKVMPYSWDNISRILSRYYQDLLLSGD